MQGHDRQGSTIVIAPKRLPRWLAAGALIIASTLLSFVLAELFLRSTRRLETFFDPLQYEPEVASEGWKRAFVRDYAKLQKTARLGTDLGGYVHDPDLGFEVASEDHTPMLFVLIEHGLELGSDEEIKVP
jgi:hypothetical protein